MISATLLVSCGSSDGPSNPFHRSAEPLQYSPGTNFCLPDGKGGFKNSPELYARFADGKDWKSDDKKYEADGTIYSAVGGGCIARPITTVWAVTHNEASLEWHRAEKWGMDRIPTADEPFVFKTRYQAGPFFHRVWWDMEWHHLVKTGTLQEPKVVQIDFAETDGSKDLRRFEGAIILEAISPEVTGYMMSVGILGRTVGESNPKRAISDVYEHLSKMEPNWNFLGAR